jgi:hypothetical protein
MGVTLGRKVIKGGHGVDHIAGAYEVGGSLANKVKTFIGLAGANLGLVACYTASSITTCNKVDGFYPGASAGAAPSTFLDDINKAGP